MTEERRHEQRQTPFAFDLKLRSYSLHKSRDSVLSDRNAKPPAPGERERSPTQKAGGEGVPRVWAAANQRQDRTDKRKTVASVKLQKNNAETMGRCV